MNNVLKILTMSLSIGFSVAAAAQETVDYSKRITASEASEWFFGKATPIEERKRMALNVGRISLRAQTNLQCGKLSFTADLNGELEKLKGQLGAAADQLKTMLSGETVLLATICYYKPNICAHMRHFSVLLQEELNMQLDACRAMDNFIDEQAAKGEKILQAEAAKQCIDQRGQLSPSQMKACLETKGRSRNLLRPFSQDLASGKQTVLQSILSVVKQSDDYDLWAQIMGEVELHENGYWAKAFPKDMLKPEDYVENVIVASKKSTCDTSQLRGIVNSNRDVDDKSFSKYVHKHIQATLSQDTISDLESLPKNEKEAACQSLGLSIAKLAIEDFTSSGRSSMTAALSNDALPDDLASFYSERSQMTFTALEKRIQSKDIRPVKEVIERIGRLGLLYRQKNRESAADLSAKKTINQLNEMECTDAFSCEQ